MYLATFHMTNSISMIVLRLKNKDELPTYIGTMLVWLVRNVHKSQFNVPITKRLCLFDFDENSC